jgi:hypothetical protein
VLVRGRGRGSIPWLLGMEGAEVGVAQPVARAGVNGGGCYLRLEEGEDLLDLGWIG